MPHLFHSKLLLVLLAGVATLATNPAIYVDNGRDQTVLDREISGEERSDMELEILELLGLPQRPSEVLSTNTNRSASRFLMDVYNKVKEEEEEDYGREKRNVGEQLSREELEVVDESDVIMTFESDDEYFNKIRHGKGKRLFFNVSKLSPSDEVIGAELRVYKKPNLKDDNLYTLHVYSVTHDSGKLERVTSTNTTGSFSGWVIFNLTGCLATWVAFPDSNLGLYLSAGPQSPDKPGHEIKLHEIGVDGSVNQPFLVAFLKASTNIKTRQKRSPNKRVKKANYMNVMTNSVRKDFYEIDDMKSCRIQTLYISFRDLKWHDWIIAPEGYAAYFCSGECNFPLNGDMNATNHAIVQTLVHLMKPLKYPKPCCAPTKLNPISVLYFVDTTNVVLKKYKKMVVKSCGCH